MKKERLIATFQMEKIFDFNFISELLATGYLKTNNKFWITYCGSKGYFSHVEFHCEGKQPELNNRLFVDEYLHKNEIIKSTQVNLFHSNETGIRISIGEDQPRLVKNANRTKSDPFEA